MATYAPQWVAVDSTASSQNLMTPYTIGSNPAYLEGIEPSNQVVQGADPSLGIGTFVYGQMSNAAGCNAGNVCEYTQTLFTNGNSIILISSFQQWAGTANSGKTLAVALAALTQYQFGWFQLYGNAFVTSNGAMTANSAVYWQAAGVVSVTGVASKQMLATVSAVASGANFGTAVFVAGTGTVQPALAATNAIVTINNPLAQGAIT